MQRILPYLIGLGLSLWLGGLVTLFLFVSMLFRADRDTAVSVAPFFFFIFERYQLAIAASTIAMCIVWRLYARSRAKNMLLAALVVAAMLGIAQFAVISPKMHALQASGDAPETFRKLHGYSMLMYVGTTVLVTVAGASAIGAISREAPHRTSVAPAFDTTK